MQNAPLPDWRAYALIATIDECRKTDGSPAIPQWLSNPYAKAMRDVVQPAAEHLLLTDADLEVRSLLATIAQSKGQRTIGTFSLWTEDERAEAIGEH
jgi:hypothetical protein